MSRAIYMKQRHKEVKNMEPNKENRLPEIPEVLGSGEYEFERYSKLLEKTSYVIGKELLFKAGKTTFIPISNFLAVVDDGRRDY